MRRRRHREIKARLLLSEQAALFFSPHLLPSPLLFDRLRTIASSSGQWNGESYSSGPNGRRGGGVGFFTWKKLSSLALTPSVPHSQHERSLRSLTMQPLVSSTWMRFFFSDDDRLTHFPLAESKRRGDAREEAIGAVIIRLVTRAALKFLRSIAV